jgi:hypothetical protein
LLVQLFLPQAIGLGDFFGKYSVPFNGAGAGLASGIYFYRLQIDIFVDTKKMVVLK